MVEREWKTLDSAAKKVWRVKGILIVGMDPDFPITWDSVRMVLYTTI